VAQDRLRLLADGRVVLMLKSAWRGPMPLDPRSVLVETPVTHWLSALSRGQEGAAGGAENGGSVNWKLGLDAAYAPTRTLASSWQ
jgi:hypothetical protein